MRALVYRMYQLALVMLLLVLLLDVWVSYIASDVVYESTEEIPYNKVGVVLGTSKYVANGRINLYYQHRIEAAVKLYQSGKIKYLIVSGDNGTKQYNEPATFKKDLVARGIPSNHIFLDYAGFRTLDSVIRAHKIFQQSFTVISQKFHNERAITIGYLNGLHVIGFNAKAVQGSSGLKITIREGLARVKMVLDEITLTEPRFYGPAIVIPD